MMYNCRQDFDDLAWDKNDDAWDVSLKWLRLTSTCRLVESLASDKFEKRANLVSPLMIGGYNILYRMHLGEDSSDVLIRLPCSVFAQFPKEKTLQEAATATYIGQHTRVPVPRVLFYGSDSKVGPFIIISRVESTRDLSDALTIPGQSPDVTPTLNPDIPEDTLRDLYKKVATCLLELSQLHFPRIGSLMETKAGSYSIAGRPITPNMNNMIRLANIPREVLPQETDTYGTADEWYAILAEHHIAQLIFQHNDLVISEDDCRNKYVSRQLFRTLAKQGRLSTFGFAEDNWSAQSVTTCSTCRAPNGSGSFRLWCDDFRPANILLDDKDDIAAVIDWEFAYAAPTQFVVDPPWWLLLDVPEMWSSGMEDWSKIYDARLKTWLEAMKEAEENASPRTPLPFKLSTYMQESWETGRFWLNYAARKSWAFDAVYWKYLDERFFGDRGVDVPEQDYWRTRVDLLTKEERSAMEPFVQRKMEEPKERILVDWSPTEAKERFSELLFD